MHTFKNLALALALASASASAAPHNPGSNSQCVQLEVPVQISAENHEIDMPRVDNNVDAIDWVWDITTWSQPNVTTRVKSIIPINETFIISAQLCVPRGGAKSEILQLATHGVGFDKRYWDVQVKPDDYSYVRAALAQGYSILTYDRLGTGLSSKPDAYTVVQAAVEIEIVKELTIMARAGTLVSSSKSTTKNIDQTISSYKPSKVIHVGHSYGSFMTCGFLAENGELSDGALITGYLINKQLGGTGPEAFGWRYAAESDPKVFADRPSGYLAQGSLADIQQIFLKKGSFEPALLDYAAEIKQSTTVGEQLSAGLVIGLPSASFKGPLQFFMGEFDYPLCKGDCKNTWNQTMLNSLYPASAEISVYIQPSTGHGLTLSTNATAGYQAMFSYLASHGL